MSRKFVTTAGPPGVLLGKWYKTPSGEWEEMKQDGSCTKFDEAGPTGTPGSTTFRLRSKDQRTEVLILDTSVQMFVGGQYSGEYLGAWEGDQIGRERGRGPGMPERTLAPGKAATRPLGVTNNDPQQIEKLIAAARSGDAAVVKELLAANVNPDATTRAGGVTALYISSDKGSLEIVEELLKYGADVNRAGREGTTPLQVAFLNGHRDVLKALFDAEFRSLDKAVAGSSAKNGPDTSAVTEVPQVPESAASDLREVTARLASLNQMPTLEVKKAKRPNVSNEEDFSPKNAEEAVRTTMREIITARERSPSPRC